MVEEPVSSVATATEDVDVASRAGSRARYDFGSVDPDSQSVHGDVVRLVGSGKRVLELGPATGYMSRAFRDRGCTVVAIELDAAMAEQAADFCERMIVGDLDTLDLEAELGDDRFDAIVAADVLEHLKDPLGLLKRLRPFLADDGCFVISVPNIAHGSVRLALLSGRFEYRDIGLLDSTHLRFFTRETLGQLLDEAELGVAELHRHELVFDASEVRFDADVVPAEVRAALEADPDARTYQFVVKAFPMAREGLRELQRRLREAAELQQQAAGAAERIAELERALAEVAGREGELRRALIDAHDQLLRRDGQIERLNQEVERYEVAARQHAAELGAAKEEALRLRVRLDRILQSPPMRAYEAAKALPVVRAVQRRRKAAFEAEVAKRQGS